MLNIAVNLPSTVHFVEIEVVLVYDDNNDEEGIDGTCVDTE